MTVEFYEKRVLEKYASSDNPENDAVVSKALAALQLQPHARLLDFGCSDGYFLSRLYAASKDVQAYGIDLVEHDAWRSLEADLSFRASDLPLPFEDGYFDAIFSSQVIEHIEDPEPAVAELSRVLRLGGRAWIATPNSYSDTWKGFHRFQHHIDAVEGHFRHFSKKDLADLFGRYGFDVVEVRYDLFIGLYMYYRFVGYNPVIKRRLLKSIGAKMMANDESQTPSAPSAGAQILKNVAFAVMRGLRAFDNLFSRSRRCQVIEVTLVKRRNLSAGNGERTA